MDFNLSARHRLSGTYYWQQVNRLPDIQNNGDNAFPGLPSHGNYLSHRTAGSVDPAIDAVVAHIVNELVVGWQWSPGYFGSGVQASQYENQARLQPGAAARVSAATLRRQRQQHRRRGSAQHAELEHRQQPDLAEAASTA